MSDMNATYSAVSFFVILALLLCTETPGSSAVTPVFVQKGKDVHLDIMKADVPDHFWFLIWRFNTEDVLISFSPGRKTNVSDNYKGRLEFSLENYSLHLKNLQKKDSGVYIARATATKDQILAEYNVTVQDPVSPVDLTVDSVSSSSDSCNLIVACSTEDSHISSTFKCDTKTCYQEGGEKSKIINSGASLRVYLSKLSVICNHSNHVSWTKNKTETELFCPRHAGLQPRHYIIVVIVVVIIFAVIIAAGLHHKKKGKCNRENAENTVYATPEFEMKPTADQSPADMITDNLVGHHTGSKGSTEPAGNALSDTLYAQVERAPRS